MERVRERQRKILRETHRVRDGGREEDRKREGIDKIEISLPGLMLHGEIFVQYQAGLGLI